MTGRAVRLKIKTPNHYQKEAVSALLKGFRKNNQGKMIVPSGLESSLISLWIKEKIKPKLTVVFAEDMRSLSSAQHKWLRNRKKDFVCLTVCSDEDFSVDSTTHNKRCLGLTNVISDANQVKPWTKQKESETVIFCTYRSKEILVKSKIRIDLAIYVDAHKMAALDDVIYADLKDNKKLFVEKRLYITATPKSHGP